MPERPPEFTKRERQIMDVLYRRGAATARDVLNDLATEAAYSTVRTQLRVLERKGHVRRRDAGRQFVFEPTVSRATARRLAVRHLLATYFEGSTTALMRTLKKQS